MSEFVLTLSCPDRAGLVYTVTSWLFECGCNILDSDQYGDPHSSRFFMRVHFSGGRSRDDLAQTFATVGADNHMDWEIWALAERPKVLVMVSALDHCLADLIYRTRNAELAIDIELVVSNHRDLYPLAAAADIDFLHLPVDGGNNKAEQELRVLAEIHSRNINFVVLARYMQVLSDTFCAELPGKIINIHHSFLPSFKGARPYHQAHAKGVKLIGATAHYVTAELDEGPIIEQDAERVDHRRTPAELVAVGRDIERLVLSRAVRFHAERRVLLNGNRTVVFQ